MVDSFELKIFHDVYKFKALKGLQGNTSVCNKDVCCSATFSRCKSSESFAVGAFSGVHGPDTKYYQEICMLVRCTDSYSACSNALEMGSTTVFTSYSLAARMPTKYAFPEAISDDLNFKADWEYKIAENVKEIKGKDTAIAAVILIGRNFDKDSSSLVLADPGREQSTISKSNRLILVYTSSAIYYMT